VLLHISRRHKALIAPEDAFRYSEFVRFGFVSWKRSLKIAYRKVFSYKQWKRLSRELRFPLNAAPTELKFEQWLGLYREYQRKQHHLRTSPVKEW
jgi:23S rRNA (adenine-N6)-dimethyltransferase